eukprot:1053536-Pleurochrysis_carterae.AAC.1
MATTHVCLRSRAPPVRAAATGDARCPSGDGGEEGAGRGCAQQQPAPSPLRACACGGVRRAIRRTRRQCAQQ